MTNNSFLFQKNLTRTQLMALVVIWAQVWKASLDPCHLASICQFLASRLALDRSCWDLCLEFCLMEIFQELINKKWFKVGLFLGKAQEQAFFSLHPCPATERRAQAYSCLTAYCEDQWPYEKEGHHPSLIAVNSTSYNRATPAHCEDLSTDCSQESSQSNKKSQTAKMLGQKSGWIQRNILIW